MGKKRSLEELQKAVHAYHPKIDVLQINDGESPRKLICKCNNCGQIIEKRVGNYKQGCPICANQQLAIGVNDIATTSPWMVAFLKNKEDAKKYVHKSAKRIWFKCPDCG